MSSLTSVNKLPAEILAEIFSYLSASDTKSAAEVCHHWYDACQCRVVAEKWRFKFSCNASLRDIMQVLQQRVVFDVQISTMEGSMQSKAAFCTACSQDSLFGNVERISLKGCDISEVLFYAVLSGCERLTSLDISNCNNLFMSGQLLSRLVGNNENNSIPYSQPKELQNSNGSATKPKGIKGIFSGKSSRKAYSNGTTSSNTINLTSNPVSNCTNGSKDMDVIAQTLLGIRELSLSSLQYLSDVTFGRFMIACPNLTHLSVASNMLVFHADIYDSGNKKLLSTKPGKKVETATKKLIQPNSAVLSFFYVLSYISEMTATLVSLDFSRTTITNEHIGRLVQTEGLKLEELILIGCKELGDTGIHHIVTYQPDLKVLNITDCCQVTDKSIISICDTLTGLTKLSLSQCRQISDHSIPRLSSLKNLEAVELNSCHIISSRALCLGLANSHHITELSLSGCTSVRDDLVILLTQRLNDLVTLDLSSCTISDLSVASLSARFLHSLRYLRLAWCQQLTDKALLGWTGDEEIPEPPHDCGSHDIGLCRCTHRQPSQIFSAPLSTLPRKQNPSDSPPLPQIARNSSYPPITHLHKLRSLDLTSCFKFTDSALGKIMNFPDLVSLQLSLCPALTDLTLDSICRGIPALERLSIAQCHRVSDNGMVRLIEKLKRLNHLDISSCEQLTSRTIESLFVNSRCLKSLNVSLCSRISAQSVEMLENHLQCLHTVSKQHIGSKAF